MSFPSGYDFMNYRKSDRELRREQEKEKFNAYVQSYFKNNVHSRPSSEGATTEAPVVSEKERYRQELLEQMNRGRDTDFEKHRKGRFAAAQQPPQSADRPPSGLRRNAVDSSQMQGVFGGYNPPPNNNNRGGNTPIPNPRMATPVPTQNDAPQQNPAYQSPLAPGVLPRGQSSNAAAYQQARASATPVGARDNYSSGARSALGGAGAAVLGSGNNPGFGNPGVIPTQSPSAPLMNNQNYPNNYPSNPPAPQQDILDLLSRQQQSFPPPSQAPPAPSPLSVLDTGFYNNYQQELRALAARQLEPITVPPTSGPANIGLGMGIGLAGQPDSLQLALMQQQFQQQTSISQQQQQQQMGYRPPSAPPQHQPEAPYSILSLPSAMPPSRAAIPPPRLPHDLFAGRATSNAGPVATAVSAGLGQSAYSGYSGWGGVGMGVGGGAMGFGLGAGAFGLGQGAGVGMGMYGGVGVGGGGMAGNGGFNMNAPPYAGANNNFAPMDNMNPNQQNNNMNAPEYTSAPPAASPPIDTSNMTPQQRYKIELEAQMRADKERKEREKEKRKQELHEGAMMLANYNPWGSAASGSRFKRGASREAPPAGGNAGDMGANVNPGGGNGYGGPNVGGSGYNDYSGGGGGAGDGGMSSGGGNNGGFGNNAGGGRPGNEMYIQMQEAMQRKEEEKRRKKMEDMEEERKLQRERDLLDERYRQEREREKADKERKEREKLERMNGGGRTNKGDDGGVASAPAAQRGSSAAGAPPMQQNRPVANAANDEDAKYDEPPPPGLGSGARTKWMRKQQERQQLRDQGLL